MGCGASKDGDSNDIVTGNGNVFISMLLKGLRNDYSPVMLPINLVGESRVDIVMWDLRVDGVAFAKEFFKKKNKMGKIYVLFLLNEEDEKNISFPIVNLFWLRYFLEWRQKIGRSVCVFLMNLMYFLSFFDAANSNSDVFLMQIFLTILFHAASNFDALLLIFDDFNKTQNSNFLPLVKKMESLFHLGFYNHRLLSLTSSISLLSPLPLFSPSPTSPLSLPSPASEGDTLSYWDGVRFENVSVRPVSDLLPSLKKHQISLHACCATIRQSLESASTNQKLALTIFNASKSSLIRQLVEPISLSETAPPSAQQDSVEFQYKETVSREETRADILVLSPSNFDTKQIEFASLILFDLSSLLSSPTKKMEGGEGRGEVVAEREKREEERSELLFILNKLENNFPCLLLFFSAADEKLMTFFFDSLRKNGKNLMASLETHLAVSNNFRHLFLGHQSSSRLVSPTLDGILTSPNDETSKIYFAEFNVSSPGPILDEAYVKASKIHFTGILPFMQFFFDDFTENSLALFVSPELVRFLCKCIKNNKSSLSRLLQARLVENDFDFTEIIKKYKSLSLSLSNLTNSD